MVMKDVMMATQLPEMVATQHASLSLATVAKVPAVTQSVEMESSQAMKSAMIRTVLGRMDVTHLATSKMAGLAKTLHQHALESVAMGS
jgi:hypothetical protein